MRAEIDVIVKAYSSYARGLSGSSISTGGRMRLAGIRLFGIFSSVCIRYRRAVRRFRRLSICMSRGGLAMRRKKHP